MRTASANEASPAGGLGRPRPDDIVVLGVDPGTAVTGYGVVARSGNGAVSLVECGVIRTSPGAPLAERLRDIHLGVAEVIRRTNPGAIAVEGVFYSKNARSALVLGHARGVILLAAAMAGMPVAEYPPAEVKTAVVGTGAATKDQVGFMVRKLLRLKEAPRPADAADGVAIALCHCFRGFGPAVPAAAPLRLPSSLLDPTRKKRP